MTSDALEEWHRYCLPAFTDRMRDRLRAHCDNDHKGWPAKSRQSEHVAEATTERRENAFAQDVDALPASITAPTTSQLDAIGRLGSARSTPPPARSKTTGSPARRSAAAPTKDPEDDAPTRDRSTPWEP